MYSREVIFSYQTIKSFDWREAPFYQTILSNKSGLSVIVIVIMIGRPDGTGKEEAGRTEGSGRKREGAGRESITNS